MRVFTRFLGMFLLLATTSLVTAQDLGGGGRLIPAKTTPTTSSSTGSALDWKVEKKDNAPLIPQKQPDLTPAKEKFVNPNVQYNATTKVIESSMANKDGKKDLGQIKTNQSVVILRYRDYAAVDGDIVKVSRNGEIIAKHVMLDGGYNGVEIKLDIGFNYIDFKVMSSGSDGPATAEYEIVDLQGNVITHASWGMEEYETGSLIINRY